LPWGFALVLEEGWGYRERGVRVDGATIADVGDRQESAVLRMVGAVDEPRSDVIILQPSICDHSVKTSPSCPLPVSRRVASVSHNVTPTGITFIPSSWRNIFFIRTILFPSISTFLSALLQRIHPSCPAEHVQPPRVVVWRQRIPNSRARTVRSWTFEHSLICTEIDMCSEAIDSLSVYSP
jgi:hypothetical protein